MYIALATKICNSRITQVKDVKASPVTAETRLKESSVARMDLSNFRYADIR